MNRPMGEKMFLQNPWIPPQREIWSGSDGSHPKRNLVWKQRIPPRREIWSRSDGSHPEENLGWENRLEKKKWSWPRPKKVDLGF